VAVASNNKGYWLYVMLLVGTLARLCPCIEICGTIDRQRNPCALHPARIARLSLPITFTRVMGVFAPVCSPPVWPHVKGLLTGAVLAPGQRTVTAVLPIMGLSAAADVHTSHRVLKRAVWSPLHASRLRLRRVVAVCILWGVVIFGLDDSHARRRGAQLNATGLDRDPVRSAPASGVNVRGRRGLACRVRPP